jgi:hypothetical protein
VCACVDACSPPRSAETIELKTIEQFHSESLRFTPDTHTHAPNTHTSTHKLEQEGQQDEPDRWVACGG